ncbi:9425_t:CDS:2, partial [Dentiscutata erythropus]
PGRSEEAASIRANNLILPQFGLFYFEVHIIDEGNNGSIAIGFCTKKASLNRMLGK